MLIISNHGLWTCQRCRYCEAKDIDKDVRRIWCWEDCGGLGFKWKWAIWVIVPERRLSVKVPGSGRGDPHSSKWRLLIHLLLGVPGMFWVLGFRADSACTHLSGMCPVTWRCPVMFIWASPCAVDTDSGGPYWPPAAPQMWHQSSKLNPGILKYICLPISGCLSAHTRY